MRLIREDYRITKEHGTWVERGGIAITAVYHPSALLRVFSKREDMLRDMMDIASRARALERTKDSEKTNKR